MNYVANLAQIQTQIKQLAQQYQRSATEIQLLAVSKTKPADAVAAVYAAGQRDFGENYLQDALKKMEALASLAINWHFIGALQSNKTRAIAENFAWVHTLASIKHAQRLNRQRPEALAPLQVCVQINIDQEPQKAGIMLPDLAPLLTEIQACQRLKLRGLMILPAKQPHFEQQYTTFSRLQAVFSDLQAQGLKIDTLSMGMSADMPAAIAAGTTLLRIGTGIFGKRPSN